MAYKVKLNTFEGPFDLLVYLIESARMDIYDIKVSEITKQYLEYLEMMKDIEVEIASEFIVLAAALIELKSKMLLPRINKDGEEVVDEDPRQELVERLLEYKKFKLASEIFSEREDEGFGVFTKPQEDISDYMDNPDEELIVNIEQFVKAFELFLDKKKRVADVKERYERKEANRISGEARMEFIESLIRLDPNKTYTFGETVQNKGNQYDVVLSFVSILEMVKSGKLTAEQRAIFGEILIKAGININLEGENDN